MGRRLATARTLTNTGSRIGVDCHGRQCSGSAATWPAGESWLGCLRAHRTASEFHEHGIRELDDGSPPPVSTVRRVCWDAKVFPVVLGAEGEVLDVGRTVPSVNRAQRRTPELMHHTVIHPECNVQFSDCDIHHVVRWRLRARPLASCRATTGGGR